MKKLILLLILPLIFAVVQPVDAILPPISASLISAIDYSGDCGQTEATIYNLNGLVGVFTEINLTVTGLRTEPFMGGTYMDSYWIIVKDGNGTEISKRYDTAGDGTNQVNLRVLINSHDGLSYAPTIAPTARPWTYYLQDTFNDGSNISYGPLIELFTFDPADYMPSCATLPYVENGSSATNIPVNAGIFTQDVAVYNASDDNGDPTLQIYTVNNEGEGTLALEITQDIIAPYIDNPPAGNTALMTSEDGKLTLYILDTGELQINSGPDSEGKIHVLIFDGIPPTNIYGYVIDPPMFQ